MDCNNGGMAIPINSDIVLTPPVPAATVMVLRDAPGGLQVLLMRRHAKSGVLGGVYVFPGGKLDAADRTALPEYQSSEQRHAALAEPDLDMATAAALYKAAVRETFEECGLRLDPASLWPWSRWITPRQPSVTNKRFDTRFFVAPAPAGQHAVHDNHEATEAVWLSPGEGLRRYWDGDIDLAPPQIMSLSELHRLRSVQEALALARGRAPALIEPEPFDEDGCRVICYPGDPRHRIAARVWPGPTRLTHRNQRFEPEGGLEALLG
jgi:8-oxo-dGTP pyrophosphatase MutT (NUDIX family)